MLNDRPEPPQTVVAVPDLAFRHARRTRRSPLSDLAERHGATGWTIYNHMLLPVGFGDPVEQYRHLKRAVQVWDVAAERQVEIVGADAERLVQLMTCRDVRGMPTMLCRYAPLVDERGHVLNDPLILRPDGERWWVSVADSDILLWARGLAAGMGLDVTVREPDVHPLAVQGPLADELAARVFGDGVRELTFFRAGRFEQGGHEHVVARCGWSGQGGFEVFVEGWERSAPLWEALFEAGADLDVRPGGPNGTERIEAGLLSWGNDITIHDDPFQCGLGRYVDLDAPSLGRDALRGRTEPTRKLRGLVFDGDGLPRLVQRWPVALDGAAVGHVTSAADSPDWGEAIAIAMLDRAAWETGTTVRVAVPGGERAARVADLPLRPPAGNDAP